MQNLGPPSCVRLFADGLTDWLHAQSHYALTLALEPRLSPHQQHTGIVKQLFDKSWQVLWLHSAVVNPWQ